MKAGREDVDVEKKTPPIGIIRSEKSGNVILKIRPETLYRLISGASGILVITLLGYVGYDAWSDYEQIAAEDPDILIFAGIGTLIGLIILYRTITYCLTSIIFLPEELIEKRNPLPFLTGTRQIASAGITKVEIIEHTSKFRHSNGKYANTRQYEISAEMREHGSQSVVICDDRPQANYILQTIVERYDLK